MKKNVILVTTGRSGSSWLETCFHHKLGYNIVRISQSEIKNNEFSYMIDMPLAERFEILKQQDEPWICKLIVSDWDHIPLQEVHDNVDAELVWVWREDVVDLFLSYAMGVMTSVYNTSDIKNSYYETPAIIDLPESRLTDFKRTIEIRNKHWYMYRHLFSHIVEYSTMMDSNPWGFTRDDALGKLNTYTPEHRAQATAILKEMKLL